MGEVEERMRLEGDDFGISLYGVLGVLSFHIYWLMTMSSQFLDSSM